MRIILYPIGGLANRMRAIDSLLNYARKRDSISVWWLKDSGLNSSFISIFKPVSFIKDKVLSERMRKFMRLYDKKNKKLIRYLKLLECLRIFIFLDEHNCLDKSKLNKAHQCLFCFIRTWEDFYPKETFHNEIFQIKNQLRLKQELSKIDANTVGVHIRRTDNVWSIENSPLELFELKMKQEINLNSKANFYLCSDDDEVKHFFQNNYWQDIVKMPNGQISRDSEDGIIQAACEMYALANTQKIIGSYWSSFGEIAARLGNIDIEICVKKS